MAPEVNKGEHYGVSADIFSFGIMLWEVCTLLRPFDGMTTEEHSKYVVYGGARPKIDRVAGSSDIKCLIKACWNEDPKLRPTATGVRNFLLALLATTRTKHTTVEDIKTKKSTKQNFGARLIPQRRQPLRLSGNGKYSQLASSRNLISP
jgi:serine/threonine protein kinase